MNKALVTCPLAWTFPEDSGGESQLSDEEEVPETLHEMIASEQCTDDPSPDDTITHDDAVPDQDMAAATVHDSTPSGMETAERKAGRSSTCVGDLLHLNFVSLII